ncbi:MAG: ORF6N domain-containing protein [Tannerellaceae bacterium]|nr:ORF6N domain-containing protein [Tannerellaceae bacterium]
MQLQNIQSKIYEIRGYKVMFDFHLAEMYQVETKRLKEQVKRNIERFPSDFMFQLTIEEWKQLVAICDQLPKSIKHSPVIPSVFTQEGVAMLSGVLRSATAIQVNINIMRAFVAMRQLILFSPGSEIKQLKNELKELREYIEEVFMDYNDINEDTRMHLELINEAIAELQIKDKTSNTARRTIGYIQQNK